MPGARVCDHPANGTRDALGVRGADEDENGEGEPMRAIRLSGEAGSHFENISRSAPDPVGAGTRTDQHLLR